MKHVLNRNFPGDLQVGLSEHDARKRARAGRLALVGECEANLALEKRRSTVAEVAGQPRSARPHAHARLLGINVI